MLSENFPHLRHHRIAEGQRGLLCLCPGSDAQLAFPLLGIGGHGNALQPVHQGLDLRLHGAFPHAEDLYIPAPDNAALKLFQIGRRPVKKHGPALPGRAGQHDHMDAVRLKGAARGRAPVVF